MLQHSGEGSAGPVRFEHCFGDSGDVPAHLKTLHLQETKEWQKRFGAVI